MDSALTPAQLQLLEHLLEFRFDGTSAALPFHERLGRENGWSIGFTARAITEYRRFVFLAMVAGHPVTPSDQVDQVWHLHLLYTKSYWDRLCGDVLGRPLHHEPTTGGQSEGHKFAGWYARTLESYRRIFQEDPPGDVWPDKRIRFGEDLHFRRVNTQRAWVVAKPWRSLR
jgi:hypothetical protein